MKRGNHYLPASMAVSIRRLYLRSYAEPESELLELCELLSIEHVEQRWAAVDVLEFFTVHYWFAFPDDTYLYVLTRGEQYSDKVTIMECVVSNRKIYELRKNGAPT